MPSQSAMSQSKERQPQRSAGGGEQATSTSDHTYGLVSVLYHALQGAETYIQYIQDAQEAGDEALVSFFRECQEEERDRASRAKLLLAERLEDEGDADEDEDEDEDEEDE